MKPVPVRGRDPLEGPGLLGWKSQTAEAQTRLEATTRPAVWTERRKTVPVHISISVMTSVNSKNHSYNSVITGLQSL